MTILSASPVYLPPYLQVLYQRSGRGFLLFFAFFSIYFTCGSLVLFTASSPYFYFFGVATVFAVVYLGLHCECVWHKCRQTKKKLHARIVGCVSYLSYPSVIGPNFEARLSHKRKRCEAHTGPFLDVGSFGGLWWRCKVDLVPILGGSAAPFYLRMSTCCRPFCLNTPKRVQIAGFGHHARHLLLGWCQQHLYPYSRAAFLACVLPTAEYTGDDSR